MSREHNYLTYIDLIKNGSIDFSSFYLFPLKNENYLLHPPFISPILVNIDSEPIIYGMVKHWFTNRSISFVKMYMHSFFPLEFARTLEQFKTHFVIENIVFNDGITDEVRLFAESLEIENLKELDIHTDNFGDDPLNFGHLSIFSNDLPINSLLKAEGYDGDFPSSERFLVNRNIGNASSYEIHDKSLLAGIDNIPKWLQPSSNKKKLFENFYDNQKYDKAWLTLNSEGWKIRDIIWGIEKLLLVNDDDDFLNVMENWVGGISDSKYSDDMSIELKPSLPQW